MISLCGQGWGQILAVVSATMTVMSDGIQYGWTSSSLILLQREDSPVGIITLDEEYWLETLYWVGGIAGLPITIFSTNKLGRKGAILLASAQNLIAWIMIVFANDLKIIYIARFISGIAGNTSFVAIPMYIGECADAKIRGFLGTMIFTSMMTGTVLGYAIVPFVPIWASSLVGVAINTIHLFIFVWMPESPYYHLLKKNEVKAEKSLKWLRSKDDVSEELMSITKAVERQSSEKGRPQDLFLVASNRKAILIMTLLNVTQHMCGISVLLMNAQPILIAAGSPLEPHFATLLFGCVMLSTLFFGSLLIDKFGRKTLLIISCLLCTGMLSLLGGYLLCLKLGYEPVPAIPLAALIGYAVANRLGLGLVPIVITGEIFPTSVKAMGMTLADFVYIAMAIVALKIYYWTMEMWGNYVPFLIFACWGVLATIVIAIFLPETKGITLEQIQMKLKGIKELTVEKNVDNAEKVVEIENNKR